MTAFPVHLEFWRYTMPRRWLIRCRLLASAEDAEPADLVQLGRFQLRIGDRQTLTANNHSRLEPVFLVGALTNSNDKVTGAATNCARYLQHIPLVGMAPFIE